MSIENYWEDVETYYIEFLTDNGTRRIDKLIVVKSEISTDDIYRMIRIKFSRVEKILHVDHWGAGLLLKENSE